MFRFFSFFSSVDQINHLVTRSDQVGLSVIVIVAIVVNVMIVINLSIIFEMKHEISDSRMMIVCDFRRTEDHHHPFELKRNATQHKKNQPQKLINQRMKKKRPFEGLSVPMICHTGNCYLSHSFWDTFIFSYHFHYQTDHDNRFRINNIHCRGHKSNGKIINKYQIEWNENEIEKRKINTKRQMLNEHFFWFDGKMRERDRKKGETNDFVFIFEKSPGLSCKVMMPFWSVRAFDGNQPKRKCRQKLIVASSSAVHSTNIMLLQPATRPATTQQSLSDSTHNHNCSRSNISHTWDSIIFCIRHLVTRPFIKSFSINYDRFVWSRRTLRAFVGVVVVVVFF